MSSENEKLSIILKDQLLFQIDRVRLKRFDCNSHLPSLYVIVSCDFHLCNCIYLSIDYSFHKPLKVIFLVLKASFSRMCYLLDVYYFTPADIVLNSTVALWPDKISPIFDQSEQVRLIHSCYWSNVNTSYSHKMLSDWSNVRHVTCNQTQHL